MNVGADVDAELVRRMDAAAREQGVSRSDVMRDWLVRGGADWERERGLLRQLKVAGGR